MSLIFEVQLSLEILEIGESISNTIVEKQCQNYALSFFNGHI